jgi:magnesium chelatase accessory protein
MFVEKLGDGPRHVVLLHGSLLDGRMWSTLTERATAEATLHVLDLPGHGRSAEARTLDYADVEQQLTQYLRGIGVPVVLVGHSVGAWLAARLACSASDSIERVVAICGFAQLGVEAAAFWARSAQQLESGELSRETFRAIAEAAFLDARGDSDAAVLALRQWLLGLSTARAISEMRLAAQLGAADAAVQPFTVPAIILQGDADRAMPLASGEQLASLGADARLTRVAGAGHLLPLQHTDLVAAAVFGT